MTIVITAGNKVEIGISSDDQLFITQVKEPGHTSTRIDLGPATDSRFAELLTYLQRLRIHAIKDGPHA